MKKLIIILAIFMFSCPTQDEEILTETDLAVGKWLLTDFTINGETTNSYNINEGVLNLKNDGTGTGIIAQNFEWWIEDNSFYFDVNDGIRTFEILELNEVNFKYQIIQGYTNDQGVIINDALQISTFTKL